MEGREGTLYFQIIHGRVARQINTGYRLFPSEWDGRMSEIILPVSGDARRSLLLALKERMEKDIRRLESIIAGLERSGGTYPGDDPDIAFLEKHFTIERDEEKIRRVERLVTAFEDSVRNRIRNHEMAAYKDSLAHRLFREAQEIRKQLDNPNSK